MRMISIAWYNLPVEFQDSGRWRSYELNTSGETVDELRENTVIGEICQNGGEIDCYGYDDAADELQDACEKVFETKLKERDADATI